MILHVASVRIEANSGMGRVAYEWQKAFNNAGYSFQHIGIDKLPAKAHPLFFGWYFRKYILKQRLKPSIIIAHEPISGFLYFKDVPLVVVSHGIEERAWNTNIKHGIPQGARKNKPIPVRLRFFSNNFGFNRASKILLLNKEDANFLIEKKGIPPQKIAIVKNGYYPYKKTLSSVNINFLFNASWIERKGIKILVNVFNSIACHSDFSLTIAGTGLKEETILPLFNENVRKKIKVAKPFDASNEDSIYKATNVFLMPSYFEGQSLALTQAMAMGLCPIASANSGQLDFLQHNVNGLLFPTGSEIGFKNAIELVMANPELITKFGNEAALSVANFTWTKVSDNVVNECISVLGKI